MVVAPRKPPMFLFGQFALRCSSTPWRNGEKEEQEESTPHCRANTGLYSERETLSVILLNLLVWKLVMFKVTLTGH
jgi:hypothetical protein